MISFKCWESLLDVVRERDDLNVTLVRKSLPAMQEAQVPSLEDPLEEKMATHSSILAWEISWTVEPGGLQSMGCQRVRYDWATECGRAHTHTHTHTHTSERWNMLKMEKGNTNDGMQVAPKRSKRQRSASSSRASSKKHGPADAMSRWDPWQILNNCQICAISNYWVHRNLLPQNIGNTIEE